MNQHLRDRILRRLEALPEERAYQILDYIEFLESKYADRQGAGPSAFARFTEAVEDRMRAGRISATAIAETMSLMNRAAKALEGAVAAGKTVATEAAAAGRSVASEIAAAAGTRDGARPADVAPAVPPPASSPAGDTPHPGSGEEKL